MLWLDGKLHESSRLPFDLRDRGLLLADGVFDTMLVVDGRPLYLAFHLERFMAAAEVLRIELERAVVERAIAELAAATGRHSAIRVTATRGAGARGLRIASGMRPTFFAIASPWDPALAFTPVRLATSSIRRNASSPLSRVKSLAYVENVLALEEAVGQGADDALILSTEGRLACTSSGNVFVLRAGELVTPPLSDGVLNGTMRERLLRLAPSAGYRAAEGSLLPGDLAAADAVFLTNSVRLVSPVTAIDGRVLPDWRSLLAPVLDLVREDVRAECGGGPFPAAA